jgi:hypothetical protein
MKRPQMNLRSRQQLLFAILGLTAASCTADPDAAAVGDAGGGGAGGGAGGAGASGGGPAAPCDSPEPLLQSDGSPTGVERCADGRLIRVAAVECVDTLPGPACPSADGCAGGCTGTHAACVDGGGPEPNCHCESGCATDADCEDGKLCLCAGGGSGTQCVGGSYYGGSAGCKTGADCASGQCQLGSHSDGCSTRWFASCATAGDACASDADCENGLSCAPGADGWMCDGPSEICGRPFRVGGRLRTATLEADSEAMVGAQPCDDALERLPAGDARDALRAHFEAMTLLEHASIASFAQFQLGLMRFGAPATLLDATAQAMRDEVEHTRRSALVVRRLSGREVLPGPLDTSGAGPAGSISELMTSTLVEACVGETLGAVEAQALAEQCADAALRETLTVIAEDEWRHAVLGWETLRWGLSALSPAAAEDLRVAADRALAEQVAAARACATPTGLEHLGLFAADARAELFATTGATLILPTLEALLQDLEARALRAA